MMDEGDDLGVDLFGEPDPDVLRLRRPVPVLEATRVNARTIKCDGELVVSATPIAAMCGVLAASPRPDGAVQIFDRSGAPAVFIKSFRQTALDARQPA